MSDTVILQKKKYEKFKNGNQVMYFVVKYNLDLNKVNMKEFTNILGLINAFIMATTFLVTFLVDNFILQLLIAFITLLPLMLLCYHMIGIFYIKKKGLIK